MIKLHFMRLVQIVIVCNALAVSCFMYLDCVFPYHLKSIGIMQFTSHYSWNPHSDGDEDDVCMYETQFFSETLPCVVVFRYNFQN